MSDGLANDLNGNVYRDGVIATGTGTFVMQTAPSITSPVLTTPVLGTPSSGNLSSCTALPITTGVSGLGTNVATFLGTPSSANLAAAITDETGSGLAVFGTSPTITTPNIVGSATNDAAAAGSVGQLISSVIAAASGVTVNNGATSNVTSISLTSGDWQVWGNVCIDYTVAGDVPTGWISLTSATLPDLSLRSLLNTTTNILIDWATSVPSQRFSLSGTTTVYLSAYAEFAAGTCKANGGIYARRMR